MGRDFFPASSQGPVFAFAFLLITVSPCATGASPATTIPEPGTILLVAGRLELGPVVRVSGNWRIVFRFDGRDVRCSS